ncbi:hypothetical protein UPYG_G00252340 [Umbra pygmaea]|uniref:Uncharacterized protein n=1 Tax=Umbra pygmaea TaxID=75934 RepID=A0ABD0WCK8_UMBPY
MKSSSSSLKGAPSWCGLKTPEQGKPQQALESRVIPQVLHKRCKRREFNKYFLKTDCSHIFISVMKWTKNWNGEASLQVYRMIDGKKVF